jgi:hypothetical protein
MGAGRPTPWQVTDVSIRQLYGLPMNPVSRVDPDSMKSGVGHAALLLSHASFRALFDSVPPDAYLSDMAVATYLGVSKLTIERKLGDAFRGPDHSWRSALANHVSTGGPAMADLRLRWSFVTGELEPMLHVEKKRTAVRRQDLQSRRKPPEDIGPVRGLCIVADCQQFVVGASGRVVGALGQGSMSAAVFIDALNRGGAIVKLDPVSALGLAWSDAIARQAWDTAVRDVLTRHCYEIFRQLDEGAKATGTGADNEATPTFALLRRKHSHM